MLDLSLPAISVLVAAAFLTGLLHGAIGLAGGVLMAAILAHFVGLKTAVPIMTCALVFSHGSRVYFFRNETRWRTATWVLTFGLPTIVVGALIFTRISEMVVALVFAAFLITSLPVKRWFKAHQLTTTKPVLATASAVWGMLAGNVIGPGFFLAPFLQGTGTGRLAFVGTMATITLVMNITKLLVFGTGGLLSFEGLILGIALGLATVPGNWLGKQVLKKMTEGHHGWWVDGLTILMIANFLYLALVANSA